MVLKLAEQSGAEFLDYGLEYVPLAEENLQLMAVDYASCESLPAIQLTPDLEQQVQSKLNRGRAAATAAGSGSTPHLASVPATPVASRTQVPKTPRSVSFARSNTASRAGLLRHHERTSSSESDRASQSASSAPKPADGIVGRGQELITTATELFERAKLVVEPQLDSVWMLYKKLLGYKAELDKPKSHYLGINSDFLPSSSVTFSSAPIWHPNQPLCALICEDEVVVIYDASKKKFDSVCYKPPRGSGPIECVAWQPLSSSVLAIGCSAGVYLYDRSEPSSVKNEQLVVDLHNAEWETMREPLQLRVTSLSWDPSGEFLAASVEQFHLLNKDEVFDQEDPAKPVWVRPMDNTDGAACKLMIWHSLTSEVTQLKRSGGAVTAVSWSPCGGYLLTGHAGCQLRLWETRNWDSSSWTDNIPNPVTSIVWLPRAISQRKFALVSFRHSSRLMLLSLENRAFPDLEGELLPLADLSSIEAQAVSEDGEDTFGTGIHVGGRIAGIAVDHFGERLAVLFEHNSISKQGDSLVALLAIDPSAFRRAGASCEPLVWLGWISGPFGSRPLGASFVKKVKNGLGHLSVTWSNGQVLFTPLLFVSTDPDASRRVLVSVDQPSFANDYIDGDLTFNGSIASSSSGDE
ncbi:WD40 repeat-like protein [Ramicandelaber brevisporus]|nr:WD40 repeat-like protein [Ramicandelaber brevisporus]